ncbi:MAG: HNH endonuclease [Bdellovibrionales bacterium]|nr:HNH endonuclease [Bdellovibrionales bacterium]
MKFSEDEACRRISAMRLHRELPEVENASISLTNLSRAESAFRREKFTREKKITILRELENKSVREGEKILAQSAPRPPRPDRVRAVAEGAVEVRFQADPALREKIEILKGLLVHKHPNIPLGELFEKLCDLGIQEWDPGRPPKRTTRTRESPAAQLVKSRSYRPAQANSPVAQQVESRPHRGAPASSPAAPRVNASLRRHIWQKARNRCENCHSRYALEIDHRIPRALGGKTNAHNLRLLCRRCNQRAAIQVFGVKKMEKHLERGG